MKVQSLGIALIALLVSVTGCARITTQVVEKPRVDQELGGNRGYLAGGSELKREEAHRPMRQMVQTDIELATLDELRPWRKTTAEEPQKIASVAMAPTTPMQAPSTIQMIPATPSMEEAPVPVELAPPAEELVTVTPSQPVVQSPAPSASTHTLYTVKSGDTLDKIAAKIYGDANQWRRIYKANQNKLTSPNRIYPGQKLVIPQLAQEKERSSDSSDLK